MEENGFDADGGTPLRREAPESPLQREGGAWNDARRLEETKETLETSFGLSRERLEALASELENPAEIGQRPEAAFWLKFPRSLIMAAFPCGLTKIVFPSFRRIPLESLE